MTNRFQPIYDIAALCAKKKLNNAILCPGSRNAPLALAFLRHPEVVSKTFSDERSAGFVALGIAQRSGSPAILLSTSGTAAFNFSPAVAEAYFSMTPLVIFTADRPAEWIAQQDGQTIFQSEIFGKHVKKSYQLPQEYDHIDAKWSINRIVNEAINLSIQHPQGPVHINAPFREPLYPEAGEQLSYSNDIRVMEEPPASTALTAGQQESISTMWSSFHNILIVAGQQAADHALLDSLNNFQAHHNIPLVGDVISNIHPIGNAIRHADTFLGEAREDVKKTLQPDLLITFGGPVISKNLKLFLREYSAKTHWHIQSPGNVADTFQSITHIFHAHTGGFFDFLGSIARQENFESQKQNNYNKIWEVEERRAARTLDAFFPAKELAEFELVKEVLRNLPANCNLHLANSMSVRYANYIGLAASQTGVKVFSNRGTCGIDGCTSTAVGHAL
ncbi:MAG: 2-succinyl-5-enolpyruvyl-6-hydroxy-3-cyclohexene-1-carboxylic-acid synthase, partial [Cyclobacteriaceae bacterium]|nr:2-succinyl-5-enolpyruvyl-6-hydroxy-3-cyclohexene-1-carboxylic-acid synthase [Cyclobacteriaceae bacterium]